METALAVVRQSGIALRGTAGAKIRGSFHAGNGEQAYEDVAVDEFEGRMLNLGIVDRDARRLFRQVGGAGAGFISWEALALALDHAQVYARLEGFMRSKEFGRYRNAERAISSLQTPLDQ